RTRLMLGWFLGLTAINLLLLGSAVYKGSEVMESTEFCGTTCHTIMAPEYVGHGRSIHAGVRCVACHIGPGGAWFVRAKLAGTRQVFEALFSRFPRPIPTPVRVLRSANETCTECHQASRESGDRRRVFRIRSDDQASSPQETVLRMRLGGRRGDVVTGIHWHA